MPGEFILYQNSPNPFNGGTHISFVIPGRSYQHVSMVIYNIQGQRVATLLDRPMEAGQHTIRWDGGAHGRPLASGVYFCRLGVGQRTKTIKMMMVR
jgi:hypothetical protein